MILLSILLAAADDPRCSSVVTSDMIACAEASRAEADAALNAAYQKTLSKLRSQDAGLAEGKASNGGLSYSQALVVSQRAWIAFRDAQCRVVTYANHGGRELPIYRRGCLDVLTRTRTKQINDLMARQ